MKEFVQEHGGIVFIGVIVMIIVAMAVPMGENIRSCIITTVTKITEKLSNMTE